MKHLQIQRSLVLEKFGDGLDECQVFLTVDGRSRCTPSSYHCEFGWIERIVRGREILQRILFHHIERFFCVGVVDLLLVLVCWSLEESLKEEGTYSERDAFGSTLHHSIGVVSAMWYDSALPTIGDATHQVSGEVVAYQH